MSLRCTKIHLHIVNWCAISINSSCSGYFVADYRYFYSDKVRMKFVYQHVIKNETDAPNGIYGRYLHVFVMLKNLNILNFKLKEPNRSKMINARWLRAPEILRYPFEVELASTGAYTYTYIRIFCNSNML